MRILGWNCWGICNAPTVRALKALIRGRNPSIVFLSETKASDSRMNDVARMIGFQNFVVIGPRGRAGGICLLWSDDLDVDILEFNSNMIAIHVSDGSVGWSVIGCYGPPYKTKRVKAWIDLCALLVSINGPWACFGDFNVVVDDSEKEGGKLRGPSTPNFLKELLFDLATVDLSFSGCQFTWRNKR